MLIGDVLADRVAKRGDHVFILHEGRSVTYDEFDRLSNRAAHVLRALGVERGDRVTLGMGNSVEYLVAAFGTLKAGGILHPVNAALGAKELGYILGHAAPRVVVADAATVATMQPLAAAAGCRVAAFGADGDVAFDTRLAASPETPVGVALGPDDGSTLLYTSGTTGKPKGVLFRHHSTGAAARHFIELLGIGPADTILAVTPLFHGNAWGAVCTALEAGGTVAFPKGFRASEFWPLVHQSRATVLYTLGTILAILLTQEPSDLERDNPLRVILGLGSAPIRDQVIRRFGVADVAECFGSTDAGVVTMTPMGAAPRKGSAGPAVPGVRLRIVDDDGQPLAARAVGEILIHSPHRMAEYFRDAEQTDLALRDGWFHTGDLGYLDEDGWLYFVDRKRDVIRRGGENMSSVLIEKTLCEHPAVAEAAVIGIPDPVLGQEVKAFIVARAPVTIDELRTFASQRLAKFQVPRLWEFRDSLPKTPTQRVEKYKLRDSGGDKPLLG
ncbi:MAG: class I adenylate-forming enzyme family protein [Candidatus Binatia bacterium]